MSEWRPLIEALPVVDPSRPPPEPQPLPLDGVAMQQVQSALVGQTPSTYSAYNQPPPMAPSATADDNPALLRAESEALALRYRTAIEDLVVASDQVIRAAETDMVRLALTIARETIMSDLSGREQFVASMVEHALSLMSNSPSITLRLGQKDLVALKQHRPELLAKHGVNVVEDASLNAGGCIAEGAQGRVDGSLEARLSQMAQKLLGAENAPGPAA